MARKSKLNFLDSLLGGAAQGFQLGKQLQGDRNKQDFQERGFGLKERQFGLNERKLLLEEQEAERDRKKNETALKIIVPFIQSILPNSGQPPAEAQAPLPQQGTPAPTARAQAQAIQQPAPDTIPTFDPAQAGQFPTTPGPTPILSDQDRNFDALVKTENEIERALQILNIKERGDEALVALDTIEQNPQSITQLQRARATKELIATQKQQSLKAEDLFGTPATFSEAPTPQQPAPAFQEATESPASGPTTPSNVVSLEKRTLPLEFPQFTAELQRIRERLGLPDFTVSGEDIGIPVNFRFSSPDLKRTTRILKTFFIADQKKLRGIDDFDILTFKKLLQKVGVSTAELQGDLDKAFEEAFRKRTFQRRHGSLAGSSKEEVEADQQDALTNLGSEFGLIPKKFEARSRETNRIIDTRFKAAMHAGGATDELGNIIDKSKIKGVLESLQAKEKVDDTLLSLPNGTKIRRSDLRAEYMLENDIKDPVQLMILQEFNKKAWVEEKRKAENAISFREWAEKFRGVDIKGGTKAPFITTQEEFDALPKGAIFTDLEGVEKIK